MSKKHIEAGEVGGQMPSSTLCHDTGHGQVHVCANPNCGPMDSIGGTCSRGSAMRPVS